MDFNLTKMETAVFELKQTSDILDRAAVALNVVEQCLKIMPPGMMNDGFGNPIENRKIIYGMIPGYLTWTMSHCERTEKLHTEMHKIRKHLFPDGNDGCPSNMEFFEWVKPYLKAPEERK